MATTKWWDRGVRVVPYRPRAYVLAWRGRKSGGRKLASTGVNIEGLVRSRPTVK
jgi:hypothetical protein